jgi:hypothetical protein
VVSQEDLHFHGEVPRRKRFDPQEGYDIIPA